MVKILQEYHRNCTELSVVVGDERVSENPALGGMHVIWVRLHNQIARQLTNNKSWSSYKIFQETRKIIGAMMQLITYKHYLPKILSPQTIARYWMITAHAQ